MKYRILICFWLTALSIAVFHWLIITPKPFPRCRVRQTQSHLLPISYQLKEIKEILTKTLTVGQGRWKVHSNITTDRLLRQRLTQANKNVGYNLVAYYNTSDYYKTSDVCVSELAPRFKAVWSHYHNQEVKEEETSEHDNYKQRGMVSRNLWVCVHVLALVGGFVEWSEAALAENANEMGG